MELKSLLALSAFTISLSATAQTTIEKPVANFPIPKTTTLVQDGTTAQYLYNVGAKAFLRGANEYMTRATLDDSLGYKFKVTVLDETNKLVSLTDSVLKFNRYLRMFADGNESIWVDNDRGANSGTWQINEIEGGNGTFTISNTAYAGLLLGGVLNDRPASMPTSSTSMGIYVNLYSPTTTDFQTIWAAVSEADYNEFHETYVAPYCARLDLYNAITQAIADYPQFDFSSFIRLYNNESTSTDELREAVKLVPKYIIACVRASMDKASLSNPIDVTCLIDACDMSKVNVNSNNYITSLWHQTFSDNDTKGYFKKNVWSIEGSSDGTNMTTPFIEDWVDGGTPLSDQICAIDTVMTTTGVYKITARVRLYNEDGAESIQGGALFGNLHQKTIADPDKTVSDEISTGKDGYFTYQSMLGYYAPEATTYAIVSNDGKLTFGMKVKDANFNWMSLKDVKVYYLGQSQEAFDVARATEMTISKFGNDALITESLKEKVNNLLDIYTAKTSTPEQVMQAMDELNSKVLCDSVEANIAAWTELHNIVKNAVDASENFKFDKYYCEDEKVAMTRRIEERLELVGNASDMLQEMTASTDSVNAEIQWIKQHTLLYALPPEEITDSTKLALKTAFEELFDAYSNADMSKVSDLKAQVCDYEDAYFDIFTKNVKFTQCYADEATLKCQDLTAQLKAIPSAIGNISTKTSSPSAIYSIGGAKQSTKTSGVNILRSSDGKTKKVVTK